MTIYALSTGPGISGLAVIRVSGKNTAKSCKKINRVANYRLQELQPLENSIKMGKRAD